MFPTREDLDTVRLNLPTICTMVSTSSSKLRSLCDEKDRIERKMNAAEKLLIYPNI